MTHRNRILQVLRGQLNSAVLDDGPNWLKTNYAGDRLSPQEIGAARDEARRVLKDLEALTYVRLDAV